VPDARQEDRPVQQAHQPPLYFAVAAVPWLALAPPAQENDAIQHAQLLERNKQFGSFGGLQGNRYVHTSAMERFPFEGWARSVHVLRLLFLPVPLGLILVSYQLARLLRPGRPYFALFAAACVAFLPQFLFLSASISNDMLAALCAAVALLIAVRWLRRGQLGRTGAIAMGTSFALGALTKETTLIVAPALAACFLLGKARAIVRLTALVWAAVPVLLLAGPMAAAQVWTVPQFVHAPRSPLDAYFVEKTPFLWGSSVANFGWMSLPLGKPRLVYDGFAISVLAGMAAFFGQAVRRKRDAGTTVTVTVLLIAILGGLAGWVYFNLTVDSQQGRYLLPVLPAAAALAALSFDELANVFQLRGRLRLWARSSFFFLAPLYALVVGAWLLIPTFGRVVLP
jgi:4-amino-4-deoxy-L-arabinose transferase-like glycosyltransferase